MLILKPSKIEGIGVFTTTRIKKGVLPPLFVSKDWVLRRMAPTGYERRFCLYDEAREGYWWPRSFYQMNIGWYLNHSTNPNCSSSIHPKTLRFIEAGEELTIDYRLLHLDL
jgi:SET domain-containing protein